MEQLNEGECNELKERILLSAEYISSNYEIMRFDKQSDSEWFVMSHSINEGLQRTDKLLFNVEKSYKIPVVIKDLIPTIMSDSFKSNKFMNNGKLIRQNNSLLMNDGVLHADISLSKVGYYDGQCTHEIVFKRFYDIEQIGILFDGKNLMLSDNNELFSLNRSRNANFIGASTLVITSDNYLLIGKQGSQSNANSGRYAPSGSGSMDFDDYRKNKRNLDENFSKIFVETMEREFYEEWDIPFEKRNFLKTKVIGYARLIEKGGKPDYFGLSYSKKTYSEIKSFSKNNNISCWEKGKQEESDIQLRLDIDNMNSICDRLDKLIKDKISEDSISIQLYIMKEILEKMKIEDKLYEFIKQIQIDKS